ncbi:FtsK/SpoIIIE domain-containing protein [Streptomyces sp. M10(2022)]
MARTTPTVSPMPRTTPSPGRGGVARPVRAARPYAARAGEHRRTRPSRRGLGARRPHRHRRKRSRAGPPRPHRHRPHFLVFGDSGSGKSSFLRTWITGLAARRTAWEARFIVIDYRRSLLGVVPPDHLGAYAGDVNAATAYVEQVAAKLAERLPPNDVTTEQLRERSWWTGPEFYLVVDDYDLMSGGRQSPLAPLVDYLPQARELGLHVVIARRVSGLMRGQMSEPMLNRLRELGADGLILSGDHREGVVLGDHRAAQRAPGRGVLVRRQFPTTLVQVALGEDE